MTEPADVWGEVADKWTAVQAEIGDGDWERESTCAGWTVRELVDHAMHWQAMGGGVLGAGTEPGTPWSEVRPAVQEALGDPANLEGNAEAFGNMPMQGVFGLILADLLLHSWDLARSIGADETLPEAAVEATMIGLGRMPAEMLRSENMFGPPIEVPEGSSPQDQLVAFTGRQP